jgi:hypothetical protein
VCKTFAKVNDDGVCNSCRRKAKRRRRARSNIDTVRELRLKQQPFDFSLNEGYSDNDDDDDGPPDLSWRSAFTDTKARTARTRAVITFLEILFPQASCRVKG